MARFFIYEPNPDVYQSFMPSPADERRLRFYDATRVRDGWSPPQLEWLNEHGEASDFPFLLGPTPVFSARAWEVLRPLIDADVEALPAHGPDGRPYVAVHVLAIIGDAIDMDESQAVINPYTKMPSRIDRYVLHEARLAGRDIMKFEQTKGLFVYTSDRLRLEVERAQLAGFGCVEI